MRRDVACLSPVPSMPHTSRIRPLPDLDEKPFEPVAVAFPDGSSCPVADFGGSRLRPGGARCCCAGSLDRPLRAPAASVRVLRNSHLVQQALRPRFSSTRRTLTAGGDGADSEGAPILAFLGSKAGVQTVGVRGA